MKNLAGVTDCDRYIERELTRCRIDLVHVECSTQEVAASIRGKLGAFTFVRAWYYWMVEGPLPLTVARQLYADPVGVTDVRASGDCACRPPDLWATHYAEDGRVLVPSQGGKQEESWKHMIEKGFVSQEQKDKYHFVDDPAAVAVKSCVTHYHVDSELGLYLLAEAIRTLPESTP